MAHDLKTVEGEFSANVGPVTAPAPTTVSGPASAEQPPPAMGILLGADDRVAVTTPSNMGLKKGHYGLPATPTNAHIVGMS